ncbi:HTH-type transcriptional regulator YesS [Paenibacillus konkukensis]|uniref:HTH-type transcriptional regulator YesS n=1 Tax=Paenibacillus konkukensis TaxID=2020716 RepID=A0ABY4RIZ7_9BACL|nr:helix-turn-helix domain-containing protein [Paenibacillus konkukensis]UQZ82392.1 HTH-type transcriptional regulator YesS [Paenibacillus konkukensis]
MYRLNSYQAKLLLFSTCISTIPIVLLGFLLYFKSSQSIQDKVNEGNRHIVEQTRLRVEQVLHGVDLSLQRLVDNKEIMQSMTQNLTPADFQFEQEIASNLNQIQRFDFGLYDVALVGLQNGWILSNYGLQDVNAIKNRGWITQYVNISGNSYWAVEESSLARATTISNERFIHLVKKIPVISDRPLGLLIAEISTHELFRMLPQNNSLGEIFIFDLANGLLAKQNELSPYPVGELQTLIHGLDLESGAAGNVSAELGSHKVGVEYQKSAYNDWLYVSIIPYDQIRKEAWRTSWTTLLGCLGLLFVANFFSIQYSRRLYSPIQRLYEICFADIGRNSQETPRSLTREGDEFAVINRNITQLQDVQSRMTQQLNGQIRQLEELFVLKLVQGEFPLKEIKEKLSMMVYDPPLELEWMSVMALQIDSLKKTRYDEKDRELLQFAVNNMVSDIIPKKRCLLPTILQNHQIVIVHTDQPDLDEFRQFLTVTAERIERELHRYLGLPVSIGISRPYGQLAAAGPAFAEAKEALKHGLVSGNTPILYYDNLAQSNHQAILFPGETERSLLAAIQYAEREKIEPLVEQFFMEITKQGGNYIDFQASFLRLFADLIRLLHESDLQLQTVYGEEHMLFQQLFTFHKVDEIKDWFKTRMIEPMLPCFETRKQSGQRQLATDLIRMIETEYDTDLTLEQCSSRLHYHPNYVSRVLKQEAGMNFSDYLAHYRLLMAKRMLVETDAKIADIAEKLRYHNSQNFIRYFRKMEGITPGKYREQHANDPK